MVRKQVLCCSTVPVWTEATEIITADPESPAGWEAMSLENEAGDSVNLAATCMCTRAREHTASFVSNVWAKNDRAAAAGLSLEREFHL